MKEQQFGPRPARPWRIVVGVLLLLMLFGNTVRIEQEIRTQSPRRDVAGALGSLTGMGLLLVGGIWFIRSGLSKP